VVTKGDISLAIAGQGAGVDVGVSFGEVHDRVGEVTLRYGRRPLRTRGVTEEL